ncbi:MAG: putative nucleotidyltransferase component of viral defense system [Candidatus Omnitrophota bacterium]|jgi:predicted nucleotidyltransferase component of viral defense system
MIEKNNPYFKQVQLLVEVLPFVAKYDCFALKGGTAINLFVQDMPRLSVDIDLTYLPVEDRDKSLANIEATLKQIAQDVRKYIVGSSVEEVSMRNPSMVSKLKIIRNKSEIKIEPNLVIRGSVFPCEECEVSVKVQEAFEMTTKMFIVSLADLYGGKICAALDRQHPRDLFDIKFLLDGQGITENIRKGFLVYLISHDRPMHESLNPELKEFKSVYEAEFKGMTNEEVSYEELVEVRSRLVDIINKSLTSDEKNFLVSFKKGNPNWSLLDLKDVEDLPAVRWKLFNIQKMDAGKREDYVLKLKKALQ